MGTSEIRKERRAAKPKRARSTKPFPMPRDPGTLFVKQPIHAKWPSLFKRHLGVLEAQIRIYDRLMQSMWKEMQKMEAPERARWESGEEGKWVTLCEMTQRTKTMLADARTAGKGILPDEQLKEKKGLGVMHAFIPIVGEPRREYDEDKDSEDDIEIYGDMKVDEDGDTEMSEPDSEVEEVQEEASAPAPASPPKKAPVVEPESKREGFTKFTPLVLGKRKLEATTIDEANPYFVVDTEPTPLPTAPIKKIKKSKKSKDDTAVLKEGTKRSTDDEADVPRKAKKPKKDKEEAEEPVTATEEDDIAKRDFTAIERQLQAEVDAGLKAREAEKKKKRKRHSIGEEKTEVKKSKKEHKKKKKTDESAE